MNSLVFIFLGLLSTFQGFAEGYAENKLTGYKDRLEMEQAIEQRLERLLLTRLEKKYFDVSSEIKTNSGPSRFPNDIQSLAQHSDYKVIITMGLSDKVTPIYREELKKWLTDWTKNQYGPNSDTQIVSRTSPVAAALPAKSSKIQSVAQTLLQLQNLIGLVLIAGVLFFITKKSRKEVKGRNTFIPNANESAEDLETLYSGSLRLTPSLSLQHNLLAYDQIKSLKKKIYWISSSNQKNTESLMDEWRLSPEQSLKFAAFCEAMAEFSQDPFEIKRLVNIWIPGNNQVGLSSQISELQRLSAEDQLMIYQEVYADLFSSNRNSITQGTSYDELVTQLTDKELLTQFEKLSERSQFLLLSKLHTDNKKRLNQLIDPQKMTRLLNLGFNHLELNTSEFNTELESWKELIRNNAEVHVSLEEQIISSKEIAELLNPIDKIHWIYQSVQKYPEYKHILAPDYKNIALLNEWNPEHLKKLCSATATKELAAVIANFPFLSTSILSACGDQTKQDINVHLHALNDSKKIEYFLRFLSNFEKFTIDQVRQPTNAILLKSVS